jgi:hypothetical protein
MPSEHEQESFWLSVTQYDGAHYKVMRIVDDQLSMSALRRMFPNAEADAQNFVLFSTSGIHGSYRTIETEEKEPGLGVTFVIMQPRIINVRYGNAYPKTPEDFAFLKALRQSSQNVMSTIGSPYNA